LSSNTTNLSLYKADPVADGNNTFNIQTMLNNNWDLIDTAVAGKEPAISTKNTAFNQNFETSTSNIKMDGTASVGTSSNVSRSDHVHPSDTSKVNITDYTKIIGAMDDTGTANTYVITLANAPSAYAEYQMFRFKAKNSNTGASTLNVNGLGTIALVKGVNTALVAGDILAGQIITVIHDGTNLQIVSANGQNLITQPMRWVI